MVGHARMIMSYRFLNIRITTRSSTDRNFVKKGEGI